MTEPCENCGTRVAVNTFTDSLPGPLVEVEPLPSPDGTRATVYRPHLPERCRKARQDRTETR